MNLKIIAVEPFYGGSHKSWLNSLNQYSRHEYTLLTLPSRWWKYRMYAGCITLSKKASQLSQKGYVPDLILATDMLDLAKFLGFTRKIFSNVPSILYFHENQFAYPENADYSSRFDNHYRFINYTSALSADRIAFNSKYNHDSFFNGLEDMLRTFPEYRNMDTIQYIKKKSSILPLGIDFSNYEVSENTNSNESPVILWNHRWEYDKNPDEFFSVLRNIKMRNIKFQLIICGESYKNIPEIFEKAKVEFKQEIIHYGTASSLDEYKKLLYQSDIIFVTSKHDFFGASIAEAVYCGCFPLLPKRLAYPEIFNVSRFNDCYYEEDVLEKLAFTIKNIKNLKNIYLSKLQKNILKYDWSNMKNTYDTIFEKLVNHASNAPVKLTSSRKT